MKKENFQIIFFLLVLCLILLFPELQAQKETAIWHFGYKCGLDFNYEPPIQLDSSAMITLEACASISDKSGNLLFYTNGIDVWNRNHIRMPNGYKLQGHISSNQAGLVIPKPTSDHIYYIFTTGAIDEYPQKSGLYYSVVDMTMDNGFGDIVEKNTLLHTNSTEALNSVMHADGEGIWVGSIIMPDIFVATLINKNGVQNAIYSKLIMPYTSHNMRGPMMFSPNGKFVAFAYPIQQSPGVTIYEFNNNTGSIEHISSLNIYGAYNLLFTRDSRSLLVATWLPSQICNYSLNHKPKSEIGDTKSIIAYINDNNMLNGIQHGLNGIIYFVKYAGLNNSGIQYFQNSIGTLYENKLLKTLSLSEIEYQYPTCPGEYYWLSLPNFIQSYFDPFFQAGLGNDTVVCAGTSVALSYYLGASVLWSTGDTTEVLTVTEPGIYSVTAAHPDNPGWIRHDTIVVTHKPCTGKCNELQTWPNPNQGQFTVSVEAAVPATLELFARNGQLIASEMLETNHTNPYPVASRLSPGTYLLRYANEVCQETVKVVVIKKQ
jgi:hypothetical protein